MMPDISVIIPTFNRADLLGDTLRSVLGQTHRPAEVIVVDDGSTDHTSDVVGAFASVRYHLLPNSGVCKARNVGVSLARGSWIAFCDSDDLWEPDKLASQVRLLAAAPDVEYSFTNFRTFVGSQTDKASKFDELPGDYWDGLSVEPCLDGWLVRTPLYPRVLRFQSIFPSTLLMSKRFFQRVGGFDERFGRTPAEDLEFTLRCVQEAGTAVVARPVVAIRRHVGNFSGCFHRTIQGEVCILEHARIFHRAARACAALLNEEIVCRALVGLNAAFAAGDLATVRDLAARVPRERRSLRFRLKCAAAALPAAGPVARRLLIELRRLWGTISTSRDRKGAGFPMGKRVTS